MSDTRGTPLFEDAECPCSGRNLEKLIQPAVLAVLAGEALHGYRVVQSLANMPMFRGRKPDNTGVYRFLKAMEDRGMVTSAWDISDSGPARKLFDLTDKGRQCLARWAATLQEYRAQIGGLLELLQKATSPARGCCCRKESPRKGRRTGKRRPKA